MTESPRPCLMRISSPWSATKSHKPRVYREGERMWCATPGPTPSPHMLRWRARRILRRSAPQGTPGTNAGLPGRRICDLRGTYTIESNEDSRTVNGSLRPAPTTWVPQYLRFDPYLFMGMLRTAMPAITTPPGTLYMYPALIDQLLYS